MSVIELVSETFQVSETYAKKIFSSNKNAYYCVFKMIKQQPPNIIRIFRIVHIDNVEYLLTHGIFTKKHLYADPNYVNIGDTVLIKQRTNYPVIVKPPNGLLGDYVPFYFGYPSPMLYNIITGHKGIIKRPQNEIVYIACRVNSIIEHCKEWCFTDGHAKTRLTQFYNKLSDLNVIDWKLVCERFWHNTEEDIDRMRRKQAEFLVKNHVPVTCIAGIVTFDETSQQRIQIIVEQLGLKLPVVVNPKQQFYY